MKIILTTILCIFVFLCSNFISSCRSSKNISKAISKKDSIINEIALDKKTNLDSIKIVESTLQKIDSNFIGFNSFSAKVKVDYNAEGQNVPDVNAFIRIKKDSIIWVNIEKLSFNIVRIIITKDSFFLLHKIDKTITKRPISYFEELTNIPFDYKTLENLIIGNPVYFKKPITTLKQNENTISILSVGDLFKHLITINNSSYLITHSKLDDVDVTRNRTCDLTYDDYEVKDGKSFAKDRNIIISEKTKIEINLKFKQFQFNEDLTFPFSIPKNYAIL